MISPRARQAQRIARVAAQHNRDMELIMAAVLRRHSNCIDVGCSTGTMLQRMLRVAPDGQHIAVEPIPDLAGRLRLKFPGVAVHEAALSDRTGTADFDVVIDELTLSGFQRRTALPGGLRMRTIQVHTVCLDDLVPLSLPVHLIKIDVEGGELAALRGAERTLKRCQPHVLLEHGMGPNTEAVYDFLTDCGLALFTVDGRGPLDRAHFGQVPDAWDYLAKPW